MMIKNGYIYIRTHPAYDTYNICKLGKTVNPICRDSQYSVSEYIRGKFERLYEVNNSKLGLIERLLHKEFSELNTRRNAGTEFYDKKIISLIESLFEQQSIRYRIIDFDEYKKNYNYEPHNSFTKNIDKFTSQTPEFLYYDLDTCKNKIIEYLDKYPDLKKYYLDIYTLHEKLCEIDDLFPPVGCWTEYYNIKKVIDLFPQINIKKKIKSELL